MARGRLPVPDDLEPSIRAQAHVDALFGDLGVTIEVANQARVHTSYPAHFGQPCPALASVEDGIRRFLVLETCMAIRPDAHFAPHGLRGVYAGTLTPNPLTPHAALFDQKAASCRQRWDWLRIGPALAEHAA